MLVRRTSLMGSLSDLLGAHPTQLARPHSASAPGLSPTSSLLLCTCLLYVVCTSPLRAPYEPLLNHVSIFRTTSKRQGIFYWTRFGVTMTIVGRRTMVTQQSEFAVVDT
jgi:hypothetical protein